MKNQDKQKKKGVIFKKAFLPAVIFCFLIFLLFLLLQSPIFINAIFQLLIRPTGLNMSIEDISLSPTLDAQIWNLRVAEKNNEGISFFVSHAAVRGGIDGSLRAGIKNAAIHEPRISIIQTSKEKKLDLTFLNKLPPIQFMEIIKGEVQFLTGQNGEMLLIRDINLILKDFSPKKGGSIKFKCKISIKQGSAEGEKDIGFCDGDFHFIRATQKLDGNGAIRLTLNSFDLKTFKVQDLSLDVLLQMNSNELIISPKSPLLVSLAYKSAGRDIALKDLELMPYVNYNIRTGNIKIDIKDSKIGEIGAFDANIESILIPDYPWKASIKASSVNIQKALEILKAFLPAPYNNWLFQGTGAIEFLMEGDYKDKRLSGSGKVSIDFKNGGFSSPEGDLAGQGVGGKFIMNIQMPSHAEKGRFEISSEINLGEFLWGKYYRDFSGKKAFFLSRGGFHRADPTKSDFSGSINLAEGGGYLYSGNIGHENWTFQISSDDINLQGFYSLFFQDYIKQDFPSLSNFDLQGEARFDIQLNGKDEEVQGHGYLIVDKGQFTIGDSLSGSIKLELPFDFFYPDKPQTSLTLLNASKKGSLHIKNLDTIYAKIRALDIPLIFSRNTILISGGAITPVSGMPLKITHLKGERLLSSERSFNLGVIIDGMEIGSYIEKALGVNIPARLDAEFREIFYQNEVMNIEGSAALSIFGGMAYANNIHGRKILSPSKVIGGDIIFEGINLEQLTSYIKLGRMSGIIKGSLKGLEIEYGQPSRFILDIESVRTKGFTQSINVDAIENFSILGSGAHGIGTLLKSGLNRFFKEYPYSRIGILCILENDVFTLRGKIREGGKEYLIRKAFLRGIDVINQNPENNIGFKDMKERINRIFEKRRKS